MTNPYAPPEAEARRIDQDEVSLIPETLEYFAEQPRNDSSAVAWYAFIAPIPAGLLATVLFGSDWFWPTTVATLAVTWFRTRQARKIPSAILRVEDSQLNVTSGKGELLMATKLENLQNVCLDTKTFEKLQENLSSGVPETRFLNSSVGPKIDNSRIELVTPNKTLFLTEHYTSSVDAMEWFGRIRRFLRRHGWQPLDERAQPLSGPSRSTPVG